MDASNHNVESVKEARLDNKETIAKEQEKMTVAQLEYCEMMRNDMLAMVYLENAKNCMKAAMTAYKDAGRGTWDELSKTMLYVKCMIETCMTQMNEWMHGTKEKAQMDCVYNETETKKGDD